MTSTFGYVLGFLVKLVLFVPFSILRAAGLLFPTCASLGFVGFTQEVLVNMANWIRFYWPVLQFLPWNHIWNLLSAIILYLLFKWLWSLLPSLMSLGWKIWLAVAVLFMIAGVVNIFTDLSYQDSTAFTEAFGPNASSTFEGGGFGGGGGGSW